MKTASETTYVDLAQTLEADAEVIGNRMTRWVTSGDELPKVAKDAALDLVYYLRKRARDFRDSCPPGSSLRPSKADLRRFSELNRDANKFLRNLDRLSAALNAF